MDTNDMSAFARKAVAKVSQHLADEAEALATEIEVRHLAMTGPQALRIFAECARQAGDSLNVISD